MGVFVNPQVCEHFKGSEIDWALHNKDDGWEAFSLVETRFLGCKRIEN